MDFALLQERLVTLVRNRVRSGEVTERGLATLAGVSQPHVHNVLKGARRLSPDMADHLLRLLHISLLDLLEREEIGTAVAGPSRALHRTVRCLRRPLGPGRAFPDEGDETYPFRAADLDDLEDPVAAQVGKDPFLPQPVQENDWVLLDRGEGIRLRPARGLYVVQIRGEALVRFAMRVEGVWDVASFGRLPADDQAILDVMKAKVVWIGRRLELTHIG
jgi:transcriptional regulator with XRE-family HTH domain